MEMENKLLGTPLDQWAVDQIVVFDWYDGPRQGLCALAHPAVEFIFDLSDEEHNPDGLDTRIFRLRELPAGSVRQVSSELSKATPSQAEKIIEALEARAIRTDLLISSCDMKRFTGCWKMGTPRPETLAISGSIPVQSESAKSVD